MEFDYYHLESGEKFEEYFRFVRQVAMEDFELCEKAQDNLAKGVYHEGILNPEKENGVSCEFVPRSKHSQNRVLNRARLPATSVRNGLRTARSGSHGQKERREWTGWTSCTIDGADGGVVEFSHKTHCTFSALCFGSSVGFRTRNWTHLPSIVYVE